MVKNSIVNDHSQNLCILSARSGVETKPIIHHDELITDDRSILAHLKLATIDVEHR
jgi:hypothetical protein